MQNMDGKTAFGIDANVGALLCYLANFIPCCLPLGVVYSVIIIVQDKTNKLARFHAFQSILLSAVSIVVGIIVYAFLFVGIAAKSTVLTGLFSLIASLVGLAVLAAIIFCAVKAFQGQTFKLPVLGDLADKWSN